MTIEEVAKNKVLRKIINKVGAGENTDNLKDLEQDLYLELMEKNMLDGVPDNQVKYILSRIAVNNIHSKNSRYHYKYRKYIMEGIDEWTDKI